MKKVNIAVMLVLVFFFVFTTCFCSRQQDQTCAAITMMILMCTSGNRVL